MGTSGRLAAILNTGAPHGFTRKPLWVAWQMRWALPSQSLQSSDNFLMSACPEARDSAKYLCTVFHLIY